MSKRLGGNMNRLEGQSSWDTIWFPHGSSTGSTVYYRGEARRYNVQLHTLLTPRQPIMVEFHY